MTMHRTRFFAGFNGPTMFLLSGKRKHKSFSDDFLVKHGVPRRSTITMIESGCMDEECWIEISPEMSKGIRSINIIQENLQW